MVAPKPKAQPGNVLLLADEINLLIYSYLVESGFQHSAYTLRSEARLDGAIERKTPAVSRGLLIEYLAKALLYVEVDTHLSLPASVSCSTAFTLLQPHACSSQSSSQRSSTLSRRLEDPQQLSPLSMSGAARSAPASKRKISTAADSETASKRAKARHIEDPHEAQLSAPSLNYAGSNGVDMSGLESLPPQPESSRAAAASAPLTNGRNSYAGRTMRWRSTTIGEQAADVRACAWDPAKPGIMATGASDGTIIFWNTLRPDEIATQLAHPGNSEITCLEFSPDGRWLASGTASGALALYECAETTRFSLAAILKNMHPIKSVRFSRSGKFLATAHLDGKVAIWNVHARGLEHVFAPHHMPCLDVDWHEDALVASCNDKQIAILAVDQSRGVVAWMAHDSSINQVRCNTNNQLLASCSDDGSCKVWKMPKIENDGLPSESSAERLLFANLAGHVERVTQVAWSPTEVMQLATCGFDSTARVWNVSTNQCLQIVSGHTRTCFGIAFSLDGGLLASASGDGTIIVTSTSDGQRLAEWREQDRQPACNLAFTVVDGQPCVCAGIQRKAVVLRPYM